MKPVRIEFVQQQRWRGVWVVALLVCLALVAVGASHWLQRERGARDVDTRISELTAQIVRSQTPITIKVDPRQASTEQAIQFLHRDYNKVFATVENLKEPGVRLRGLTLEVSSNTLRLEYDLESIVKAAAVSAALNTGYEDHPWKLESVSGPNSPATTGLAPTVPVFRGVWVAQVDKM